MITLVQRVTGASLRDKSLSKKVIAQVGPGMLVLVGIGPNDTLVCSEQMARKLRNLRIFTDENGKMNLSSEQVNAALLLVSQFTLYADCRYGNRPSFQGAAPKEKANQLYGHFVEYCQKLFGKDLVQAGPFGGDLEVELVNDGPVTIWLDSDTVL